MRVGKTPYIMDWENNRQDEIKKEASSKRPLSEKDIKHVRDEDESFKLPEGGPMIMRPWFMGQVQHVLLFAPLLRPHIFLFRVHARDILHGMCVSHLHIFCLL